MEQVPRTKFKKFFILCALCMTALFAALTNGFLAPFYPQEAEKKGATATEYGAVFGVFSFATIISSPIYGKYLFMLGIKATLYGGFFVAGTSVFVFGLLDLVDSHDLFVSLCCALRFVQALGTAAATTACFSITATVFPGSIATFFATVEIFTGLGYIIGPIVGGYLFELGGFQMPYMVIGPLMLLGGVLAHCILNDLEGSKSQSKVNIFSVLNSPSIALDMASVTTVALCFGFLLPTLEPHLRQFNLSPVDTGFVFICAAVSYMVTASIVGILCDKYVDPRKMVTLGHLFVTAAFISVGPGEYIPMETTVWIVCIGLMLQGLGFSCIYVPAFTASLRAAVKSGLPDDVSTFGVVNGLVLSSFSVGTFIGPIAGGYLLDQYGFRRATLALVIVNIVVFILRCLFACLSQCSAQSFIGFVSSTRGSGGEVDTLSLVSNQDAEDRYLTEDITQARTYGSAKKSEVTFFKRYGGIDQHKDGSFSVGYSKVGQQGATTVMKQSGQERDDIPKGQNTTVHYIAPAVSGDTITAKEPDNIEKHREEKTTGDVSALLRNVASTCTGGEIVQDKLLSLVTGLGSTEQQQETIVPKHLSFLLHNTPIMSEQILTGRRNDEALIRESENVDQQRDDKITARVKNVLHDTVSMDVGDNFDKVVSIMGGRDNVEKHQGDFTTKHSRSVLHNAPEITEDLVNRTQSDVTLTKRSGNSEHHGGDITTEHVSPLLHDAVSMYLSENISQDKVIATDRPKHQRDVILRQISSVVERFPVISEEITTGRQTSVTLAKESSYSDQHRIDITVGQVSTGLHDAASMGAGSNIQDGGVAVVEGIGDSAHHQGVITKRYVSSEIHNEPVREETITGSHTDFALLKGSANPVQHRGDIKTGPLRTLFHDAASMGAGSNIIQDEVVTVVEGIGDSAQHQRVITKRYVTSELHNEPVREETITGSHTDFTLLKGSANPDQHRGDIKTGPLRTLFHDAASMGAGSNIIQDEVVAVVEGIGDSAQHQGVITKRYVTSELHNEPVREETITGSHTDFTLLKGSGNPDQHRGDIKIGPVRTLLHDAASMGAGSNIIQDEVVAVVEGIGDSKRHQGVITKRYVTAELHNEPVREETITGSHADFTLLKGSGNPDQQRGDIKTGAVRTLLHDAASMGVGGSIVRDKVVTVMRGFGKTGQQHEDMTAKNDSSIKQDELVICGNSGREQQNENTLVTGDDNTRNHKHNDDRRGKITTEQYDTAVIRGVENIAYNKNYTLIGGDDSMGIYRDIVTGDVITVLYDAHAITRSDITDQYEDFTVLEGLGDEKDVTIEVGGNIGRHRDCTTGQISTVNYDDAIITSEDDVTIAERRGNTAQSDEASTSRGYVSTVHYDVAIRNEDGSTMQHNDVTMMISRGNSDGPIDVSLNEDSVALSSIIVTTLQRIIDDNADEEQSTTLTFRE